VNCYFFLSKKDSKKFQLCQYSLDPDPDSLEMLDPDPDSINPDPQHRYLIYNCKFKIFTHICP
jgi:hypothetical protein